MNSFFEKQDDKKFSRGEAEYFGSEAMMGSAMPPPFQLLASSGPHPGSFESIPAQLKSEEEEEDDGWGFMDWVHTGLDVAGMIPGVGEVFDGINAAIYAAEGDYENAALSAAAMIPLAGNVATGAKWAKRGLKAVDAVNGAKKAENVTSTAAGLGHNSGRLKKKGRTGKMGRLKELAEDDKLGKADRGWIKQEMNEVKRGKKKHLRLPPGKELAHERGRESAKGFSYKYSNLQDKDLHKLQHKYDKNGKLNKIRPVSE